MANLSQYTNFLKQQREVMENFRELIRMEKEDLKLPLSSGDALSASLSQEDLKKATENLDELKLFEYFVAVQINAIDCADRLTQKFKDKILEMEKQRQDSKAAKAKEEKDKEKLNKAFEVAKAKIDAESETLGEAMFETNDEEILEQVKLEQSKKSEEKKDQKPKPASKPSPEKGADIEESLFDLFG